MNCKLALTVTLAIVLLLNIKTYQQIKSLQVDYKRNNLKEIINVVSSQDNNLYFYSTQTLMDDLKSIFS